MGEQPPANRFLSAAELSQKETAYPLRVYVCGECLLVQLADVHAAGDIFTADYAYYSSTVKSWVEHAARYVEMITERLRLGAQSFVVEVASNDGYLLQHFQNRSIPCLGIDPAAEAAATAEKKGVRTMVAFFGADLAGRVAEKEGEADLIVGNNVFAHVPAVNDFVSGLGTLLKPGGVVTLEFPHVAKLVELDQFDTIYDEHFSYFSLGVVRRIFGHHGLAVFDVEELPTHGGSLRVYGRHTADAGHPETPAVEALLAVERDMGLDGPGGYASFQGRVDEIRDTFLRFLGDERAKGSRIAAFGAAAKGNTFLNYCGIDHNAIDFVVDDTPAKQGRYLPGSHIPVVPAERIADAKPDIVLILPWNLKADIKSKLTYISDWGGRFVTCIPRLEVS